MAGRNEMQLKTGSRRGRHRSMGYKMGTGSETRRGTGTGTRTGTGMDKGKVLLNKPRGEKACRAVAGLPEPSGMGHERLTSLGIYSAKRMPYCVNLLR
jgi:hypothetical protein